MWQHLIQNCSMPLRGSFSIVAPEFGANYPKDFSALSLKEMKQYKGAYGQSLSNCKTWDEIMKKMPSYTQKAKKIASWIVPSIEISRNIFFTKQNFYRQMDYINR